MGTTLVAVLVDGSQFSVANVGDSRVYLVSAEGIRRLTEDHSFVAEAMKRGQSEAEAMATPWKDALTRSIGTDEEVEVDVFGPYPIEDDSAFLMCSDGLYKTLDDDELRDLFKRSGGARGAAQSLVAAAFDAGSDDNISVAIAEYGDVPRDEAPTTMILAYDGGAGVEAGESAADAHGDREGATAAVTDEAAVVGGLPMAALAAILVVGVLVAILILGG
jgi:serine/threonine protein phosphatase PrpC